MESHHHLLIRAAFKQPVERTPVWVMRQAGRYLPQYREVREKAGGFLDLCYNPELAAEVSIQPMELMEVDAVIMFSDILTPLVGMGVDLDFTPGPVIHQPIREQRQIEKLVIPDPAESVPYVGKILTILRKEIRDRVPLIGFAGAPFTLAAYLVEGGSSKTFRYLMTLMRDHSDVFQTLMEKLTRMTIEYLDYQIEHGAQVFQLFDTWAGILNPSEYNLNVLPFVSRIFEHIRSKHTIPSIYYINGGNHLLEYMADAGPHVVSLDWRSDIKEARRRIGDKVALQGNLNPTILFCGSKTIRKSVRDILDAMDASTGHIFNLGHGIDKDVNPDNLLTMVRAVKEFSLRTH